MYKKGDEEEKTIKKAGMVIKGEEPEEEPKPTLHLSVEDLPAIKNWEVGKKYKIALKVKEVSKMQSEDHNCGIFEIEKAKEA